MSFVQSHSPGSPSWADLATTDGEGAKKFYTSLFGWEYSDTAPMDMVYTMYNKGGKSVAGSFQRDPSMGMSDQPPCWQLYFTTDNLEETLERVNGLNGKVVQDPFEVPDAGRSAVAQDPQNAVFMLWEPKNHIGVERMEEAGAICWTELATTDSIEAVQFYKSVLQCGAEKDPNSPPDSSMDYTMLKFNGQPKSGIRNMTSDESGMSPYWSVIFGVDDINASTAKVQELGGKVVFPPTTSPYGHFSAVMDPQGAYFQLLQPAG